VSRKGSAALALALVAAAGAGCGGGRDGGEAATRVGTGEAGGGRPSPVTVVGSSVAVDPRHITLSLRLEQPKGIDPPVAKTATVTLRGNGIDYDGARQPACDAATIRGGGVDACPEGSVVGTGEAVGMADTAETKAQITIVNGGRDGVLLSTLIRNPAYVKAIVPGRIAKRDGGLTIAFTFPPELQDVGGVPIGLRRLTLALTRGGAVTAARCDGWRYDADVGFSDDTVGRHQGRVACRPAPR